MAEICNAILLVRAGPFGCRAVIAAFVRDGRNDRVLQALTSTLGE